jgi:signal transduction histidine kinase
MLPSSLFRSTPFRLALFFALLFFCAFIVSGAVAFRLISGELDARYTTQIRETFQIIRQTYADHEIQDLIEATRAHAAETVHRQNIFLLTAPSGRILAGNMKPHQLANGWSERKAGQLGLAGNDTYRLLAGAVGPYRLIVGMSDEETRRLERVVLGGLAWTSIVIVLLAIVGGSWLASRAQRRLDAAREAMRRVSQGQLSSRIPLLGRGDDLDQLSRDVNEALDRLSVVMEAMRQVSADIAHDLKTPLGHLKITLEEARLKHERGGALEDDLARASREADEINQIFDALLRITQIESGARKSRFAPVDINGLFEGLFETYREVARDEGHSLECRFDVRAERAISGDRQLLVQMYANLIENAIRHTPPGSLICLGITERDDGIYTFVEDNGFGVPKSEREKVFHRLYRLERSRTSPGAGLGLSLVRAIADLHGADLRLEDANPGLRAVVNYHDILPGA